MNLGIRKYIDNVILLLIKCLREMYANLSLWNNAANNIR